MATVLALLACIEAGLRVPGLTWLTPFGRPGGLDYSTPPTGAFNALRQDYVESILGIPPGHTFPSRNGSNGEVLRSAADPPDHVVHALTNDDVESAYVIRHVPFTARTDTSDAQRSKDDPSDCSPLGRTVWYRLRTSASTGIIASASSRGPTALAVYAGKVTPDASSIACDSTPSGDAAAALQAIEGVDYYFQLTTQLGGELVFAIQRPPRLSTASVVPHGRTADGDSYWPKVSGNGRYVVFRSSANNLDDRCPCGAQIYRRDLATSTTELVSLAFDGAIPNASSDAPSISADGRYVAWHSLATNVVPEPTWSQGPSVFVRDVLRGSVELVSTGATGEPMQADAEAPSISADGSTIAFQANHRTRADPLRNFFGTEVFVWHRATRATTLVSANARGEPADHDSRVEEVSPDGRYVMFWSRATNLIDRLTSPLDEIANRAGFYQGYEYVKDLRTGGVSLECVAADGTPANDTCQGGRISWDGRYSAFLSAATNLTDPAAPTPYQPGAFMRVYRRDRLNGAIERVDVPDAGWSAGEMWLPRQSPATGSKRTIGISLSWDGRYVGFDTEVQLDPDDDPLNRILDSYLRDVDAGHTVRLSETADGRGGNGASEWPSLSADGRVIVFQSHASNLVDGDVNGRRDIIVRI